MATIHQQRLALLVEQHLDAEPSLGGVLLTLQRRLKSGYYAEPWPDIVKQSPSRTSFDLDEAYVFFSVWQRLLESRIVVLELAMGMMPGRDHERALLDGQLKKLRPPLSGTFHGGPGDEDGAIAWSEPVPFECFALKRKTSKPFLVSPSHVALEVGTTEARRTLAHLTDGRGVARWPYCSTSIYVLVDRDPMKTRVY